MKQWFDTACPEQRRRAHHRWLGVFAACFFVTIAAPAGAQTQTGPPDVKGWPQIGPDSYIELKVQYAGRNCTAYLGVTEHFKNPVNERERVSVIKRFLSILPCEEEVGPQDRTLGFEVISTRRQNDLTKRLKELKEAAEVVAYERFEVSNDPETRDDVRTDGIQSWILGTRRANGPWVSDKAGFKIEPLSERVKSDPKSLIPIGFKYSLKGDYHILRFDQNFLPSFDKTQDKPFDAAQGKPEVKK